MALAGVFGAFAQSSADKPTSPEIELRGRLARISTNAVSLKADDGKQYSLVRTKLSEALFADPRLMEKHLVLKGRLAADKGSFDVTFMRSLVNGTLHDLYYWCDICAVHQVTPGECVCCREDVILTETPVGTKPAGKNSKKAEKSK
jgi:hypothetical protein